MLKNILKLNGAQKLSKNEQQSINGGGGGGCGAGTVCSSNSDCSTVFQASNCPPLYCRVPVGQSAGICHGDIG